VLHSLSLIHLSRSADSVAQQKDEPCDDYWSAAAAINRLYAEMHGYHFYLWGDVHNAVSSHPELIPSAPHPTTTLAEP
jgi:hypothetical protein